jgi:hypothetical protein
MRGFAANFLARNCLLVIMTLAQGHFCVVQLLCDLTHLNTFNPVGIDLQNVIPLYSGVPCGNTGSCR